MSLTSKPPLQLFFFLILDFGCLCCLGWNWWGWQSHTSPMKCCLQMQSCHFVILKQHLRPHVLSSTWYCCYFRFNNGFALSIYFGFNLCLWVPSVFTIPTNAPLYWSISFLLGWSRIFAVVVRWEESRHRGHFLSGYYFYKTFIFILHTGVLPAFMSVCSA